MGTSLPRQKRSLFGSGYLKHSSAQNSVTNTYTYDKAGRLTEATVDKNKYTYGYAAPNSSMCNQANANLNAHKNSNRTSYTVTNTLNNQVTNSATYCYDQTDRLLVSSDAQIGTPAYDDHGNTVSFAGAGTPVTFTYDASDANTAITQGNNKVAYVKSAGGSVLRKKEYVNNTLTKSYRYVAGGSVLQSCALNNDSNCTTTDKYVSLPGGVTLTLSPSNPQPAQQEVYSVKNFHGDTAMTAGPDGAPTSSVFLYEPFGQSSASVTFGTGSNPQNSVLGPMGWAASPSRVGEQLFSLPVVQMGARVYLPSLGRFAQVDPVEGGTANSYVYVGDPVNEEDYSGQCGIFTVVCINLAIAAVRAAAPAVAKALGGVAVWQAVRAVPKIAPRVIKAPPHHIKTFVNRIGSTGSSPYRSAPFKNDGRNNGQILPQRSALNTPIRYTEHDIYPITDKTKRGLERIVTGNDGSMWYTADHYKSFIRIK